MATLVQDNHSSTKIVFIWYVLVPYWGRTTNIMMSLIIRWGFIDRQDIPMVITNPISKVSIDRVFSQDKSLQMIGSLGTVSYHSTMVAEH